MIIVLAAALAASAQPLPFIDRSWLDTKAKIEVLRPRKAVAIKASALRSRGLPSSDLTVLGAVCGAAAKLPDPIAFLNRLGAAYSMSPGEVSSLRESCSIYLAGQAAGR